MQNKFTLLLNKLNLPEADYEGITAKFHHDKINELLSIALQTNKLLTFKQYKNLIDALNKNGVRSRILIQNESKDFDLDIYLDFFKYFFESEKVLERKSFTHDDNVVSIELFDLKLIKEIDDKKDFLEKQLKNVGFGNKKIKVNFSLEKKREIQDEIDEVLRESLKNVKETNNKTPKSKTNNKNIFTPRRVKDEEIVAINKIDGKLSNAVIVGEVFDVRVFTTKNNKKQYTFCLTDYEGSIYVKIWSQTEKEQFLDNIQIGMILQVSGMVDLDPFDLAAKFVMFAKNIEIIELKSKDIDESSKKRVELSAHTNMSTMDGINSATDLIEKAVELGHSSIAIVDHSSIQAFPEAQRASKKHKNFKVIYGSTVKLVDDVIDIIHNNINKPVDGIDYVVFDLETTGLSCVDNEIIEFGAVKIKSNGQSESRQFFVKPKNPIPANIIQITSITNETVKNAKGIEEMIHEIKEFFGDAILVAHNASFDIGFIEEAYKNNNLGKLENAWVDTMQLARATIDNIKSYRLGAVARFYKIVYDDQTAHRADYDARVLADCFIKMRNDLIDKKYQSWDIVNSSLQNNNLFKRNMGRNVSVLAKNAVGIKNLFKIISLSLTKDFSGQAKIRRADIDLNREGLLIGTSNSMGEIFEIARNKTEKELEEVMSWYDYVEVQPPVAIKSGRLSDLTTEDIQKIIIKIIKVAQRINKIIVATGDVYYISNKYKKARDVYIASKGIGGVRHPLYNYRDALAENPVAHLMTTKEMLEHFNFLDKDLATQIVINNTQFLADEIEKNLPMRDKLYAPAISTHEGEIKKITFEVAHKKYGEKIPAIINERIERELKAIISHGYEVIYWSAHKLVKKSLDDGYLVGSRGSVGSSIVAFLCGITEVNPLPPHYICDSCTHTEFNVPLTIEDGFDLVEKDCPNCNKKLKGDGHNISFETFMGFEGDKIPDIDLNFSGDYQHIAHEYTKELFGKDYVYRAGTISTVANKTAYGYVKAYLELINEIDTSKAEIDRLVKMCEGVKRTTGQHPGGIIVIPNNMEVNDFTPVNYPADDFNSSWLTTHFEFEAIHDNLLKLDLLGHQDPTAIKKLQDLTGVNALTIPTNDRNVLEMFLDIKKIVADVEEISEKTGAIGIPEFGTEFVRRMLVDASPKSFADLIRISGLSHGTNVWLDNAQHYIKNNQDITLKDVISVRDDIMFYLITKGIENKTAFFIMEAVRKGKGLTKEQEELLVKANVPGWYIESCKKIKYIFPKAHATAYVMMAWRIAWFKFYHPLEYYAVFFSTRFDVFEIETVLKGKTAIKKRLEELKKKLNNRKEVVKPKEKEVYSILESVYEMYLRGYEFANIDLYKSDAKNFIPLINEKKLLLPFNCIDGLGLAAANSIVEARAKGKFVSIEDLERRTQINKNHLEFFKQNNIVDELPDRSQIALF